MDKDEYIKRLYKDYILKTQGCATTIGGYVFVVLLIFFLCSCATKTKVEYVDRDVYKTIIQHKHDTLINDIHDSVYLQVFQKGDTIFQVKYKEKTKYINKVVYVKDTIYKDSIQTIIKEVVKTKEPWYVDCSLYVLAFGILLFIFFILKHITWQTKN